MYSHTFISVTDFPRALKFYNALMTELALEQKFVDATKPWAGWHSAGKLRPLFVIGHPFDGQEHQPGNGQMIAFAASNRAIVQRAHAAALAHGGVCEGAPGLRLQYHPDYYGAYFRDPDGNKLCVACHADDIAEPATNI